MEIVKAIVATDQRRLLWRLFCKEYGFEVIAGSIDQALVIASNELPTHQKDQKDNESKISIQFVTPDEYDNSLRAAIMECAELADRCKTKLSEKNEHISSTKSECTANAGSIDLNYRIDPQVSQGIAGQSNPPSLPSTQNNRFKKLKISQPAFCKNCGMLQEFVILQAPDCFDYKGKRFYYTRFLAVCPKCDAELPVKEVLDANAQTIERIIRENTVK